jgi:dienelactone hydrolase
MPYSLNLSRRTLVVGAIAIVAGVAVVATLLSDPRFLSRRSVLKDATSGAPSIDRGYELRQVRLTATSGLSVELTLRRAASDTGRLPLVLILGGHYKGRDAVKLLPDTRGTLVAVMSYPFDGDPRPDALTFLREIPTIRAAFLDTPLALMLSLDYLLGRPDVDTTRVEAIGVSLGAPFVTIAGALDSRITRVWVLHGSGGSFAPLEQNMRRNIPLALVRYPAAALSNLIIDGPRLAPERWVARIAPRPFVMVNALGDERLPRESVDALYRAAREPKEQIWMPGRHVHSDSATISRLTEIVLARMREVP